MYEHLPLSQRIDRAVAAVECEKAHSLHVDWHAAGIHREEYTDYWSKRNDITWAHASGQMGNRWTYWQNYVLGQELKVLNNFRQTKEIYPEVENAPDWRTLNEYSNHFVTSPIIEVAEDAQSAQALFYTPGYIAGFASANGQQRCMVLYERYGADFVFEDGQWLYLNLRVCPDIGGQIDGSGFAEKAAGGGPGGPGGAPGGAPPAGGGEGPGGPPPEGGPGGPGGPGGDGPPPQQAQQVDISAPNDIPGPLYNQWSPTQMPQQEPRMPLPYKTQADIRLNSDVKTL